MIKSYGTAILTGLDAFREIREICRRNLLTCNKSNKMRRRNKQILDIWFFLSSIRYIPNISLLHCSLMLGKQQQIFFAYSVSQKLFMCSSEFDKRRIERLSVYLVVIIFWIQKAYLFYFLCFLFVPLHKKWSFPLVNVTKSTGNCGFGHIYWRNS